MSEIQIDKINSIIATEMLLNTYGLDVLKHNVEDVENLIKLLQVVKPSLPNLKTKANENNPVTEE